jgi:hypothetical protein
VQTEVREFMRECEAIAVEASLEDEPVDGNAGQVARNGAIDLKQIAQSGQGYNVEAAFDLSDLFDRCWNRPRGMEFAQELLG